MNILSLTPETETIWKTILHQHSITIPFLTFEWHNTYFLTNNKKETPLMLHIPEYNVIAPFAKNGNVASFVGSEITDYSDIIGSENDKKEAWNLILKHLSEQQIQNLLLTNIPSSSSTYSYFSHLSTQYNQISISQRDTTPTIHPLPATYESYLSMLTRKNRHELERKQRKFLREHEQTYICTKIGKKADMDILIRLMKLDQKKRGFFTFEHEAFFQMLPISFPHSLVTMILYVDDVPATGLIGFQTSDTFLLYNSGFDQEHFSGGGYYLKAQSIHYAISQKLTEYNFLRGAERYKYDLGGKDFLVYDVRVNNLQGMLW